MTGAHVERVGVSGQEKPARGVAQHRDQGVPHSLEDAARHGFPAQAEAGMDAGYHVVETGQEVVGEVEGTVRQDVAFRSFEEPERVAVLVVEPVNGLPLVADALEG